MFTNKQNKVYDDPKRFPVVKMSTFIGPKEDVLALVGSKFMLFT
jgi:hypothetical protein